MPRFALALSLVVSLAASSALAQIGIQGVVSPSSPLSFPTPPFNVGQAPFDTDGDGILDWLTTGGNGRAGLDQRFLGTFPDGTDGFGGIDGFAWNAVDVWRGYETPQNIVVGDGGFDGGLSITAGGELRYQYLVLGAFSEEKSVGANTLSTEVLEQVNDFNLSAYLGSELPGQAGFGSVTVSGAGSVYNNDPNVIPSDLQATLNLANGADISDVVTDLETAVDGGSGNFMETPREVNGTAGFDVIVGLNGGGRLEVTNGGRVEIQDALMVAVDQASYGDVLISGSQSSLVANGREELLDNYNVDPSTAAATSFVGGAGVGTMRIEAGGRAEFKNGLSIGRAIGGDFGTLDPLSTGAGTVTVTGPASRMHVDASAIAGMAFDGDTLALSIGEQVDSGGLVGPISPGSADVQPGQLTIADGAVVSTGFDQEYGTTEDDTNVAIGKNGLLELRDGTFAVGNGSAPGSTGGTIYHDGEITGHGLIQGRALETSVHAEIRGGDADANQGDAAERLRIVLNGPFQAGSPPATASFTNRGLVEGLVSIETAGEIDNFGFMNGSISLAASGNILNTGNLEGSLAIDGTSALVNGSNLFRQPGASAGTIRGAGTIQSATFINNAGGEVRVGEGEKLTIVATAINPITSPAIVQDGGTPTAGNNDGVIDVNAPFFQANLGGIVVDGGELEVGRVATTVPTPVLTTQHRNLFRNARVLDTVSQIETLGTIVSRDGSLHFREGLYNTGVVSFTGGDNVVSGVVVNAGRDVNNDNGTPLDPSDDFIERGINYDNTGGSFVRPGVILVSGNGTTATFEDTVVNDGLISIGPFDNVVNFLGDLIGGGTIQVAVTADPTTGGATIDESAYLVVAGDVTINGGALALTPVGASASAAAFTAGYSVNLIEATSITAGSLFTSLELPELADGMYWDVIYDQAEGDIGLEVIESLAFGADFTGDGIVTQSDVDVWIQNAGIQSGASVIQGDADLDGDVDLADYEILQQQLLTGVPALVGAASTALASVPEPSAAVLAVLASLSVGARRRR